MKAGVIQFPGSNDEHDAAWAIEKLGFEADIVFHTQTDISKFDFMVLPGGFSYGDYLRCGALAARFSPVMEAVKSFAKTGGQVLGICNGFQILCESGLLPGALLRNKQPRFISKEVNVKVSENVTPLARFASHNSVLRLPIKHGEGRYYADRRTLSNMRRFGQIVLQYCSPTGEISSRYNPNGSSLNIAGVCNKAGNVIGMMPHPEHAVDPEVGYGSSDGSLIFNALSQGIVTRKS